MSDCAPSLDGRLMSCLRGAAAAATTFTTAEIAVTSDLVRLPPPRALLFTDFLCRPDSLRVSSMTLDAVAPRLSLAMMRKRLALRWRDHARPAVVSLSVRWTLCRHQPDG